MHLPHSSLRRLCLVVVCLLALVDAFARQWRPQPPSPRVYQPTCLAARQSTWVSAVHDAQMALDAGLDRTYTGRGILLGVIDIGFEFSHLNFRDPETGQSRLSAAVIYRPLDGAPDEICEYYDLEEQLDTLTTDTHAHFHGTHTAGVAAGSYPGLGLQGMAPEADLMLCGTSALTDERLIDAMGRIFRRADELDVPCVINLSIGSPVDWKDGLTPFCLACDSLTQGGTLPGRVIVVSSGNDGAKRFTMSHSFADQSPVYALLQPCFFQGKTAYVNPNIDVYCADAQPLELDFVLYDTLHHTITECPFEQHLLDTLEAGHDGRRHLCLDADTCLMPAYPHQLLAARFASSPGAAFDAYYINNSSVDYAVKKGPDAQWLEGSAALSINDLCCSDAVISVGAYSAVDEVVNVFGRLSSAYAPKGEICAFSSYGESFQGSPKPDVVCPGATVVSSFSAFCDDKVEYYYTSRRYLSSPMMHVIMPDETDVPWFLPDDPFRTYYWAHATGTSQSAPVMSGIIALWLEACPTLSVRDVRDILQRTSRFDDQCLRAPGGVMQAGNGKADALAGIRQALGLSQGIDVFSAPHPAQSAVRYDLMGRPLPGASLSSSPARVFVAPDGGRPSLSVQRQ